MNKYQKSLNNIVNSECEHHGENGCQDCRLGTGCLCDAKGWVNDLQELVERATPKKPFLKAEDGFDIEVSGRLVCDNCRNSIANVWNNREYKPKFCHYCGQAIDWE